ncbi:alpha/beta hydrolase fold protein [Roseobacter cerasinus]|uniref:Alpha/beta hydrolase fold protein n=1 Tax=Roseobacter cerasinus TaxID=2602289 RepID=A0A640VPU0_9RHOB|nr:alpha/beta hydrolase [Roseobacter cerasinus]GFE49470.1 alpha/beta hydrolase fold protein [Roseobacter cerasinus]
MPELARPGATLHYEITGSGPPLILIAGMMSDSASWAPLIPHLSGDFTLICPDNRTTGRTTPWDAPASPQIWAEDALALLDHLGHETAHVLGHSLGGYIAWAMASLAPERLAGCIMMASAPLHPARNAALFQALLAVRRSDASPDSWLRLFLPWIFTPATYQMPGAIDAAIAQSLAYPYAQSADAMAHQIAAVASADPTLFQSRPEVPLQALLGENDLLTPLTEARNALAEMPVTILEGCGHAPHWDAPDQVADHLRSFIRSL